MIVTKSHLIGLCILGATYVAGSGNDGWGWLIVLAVLLI
jgi:hypothetical protein